MSGTYQDSKSHVVIISESKFKEIILNDSVMVKAWWQVFWPYKAGNATAKGEWPPLVLFWCIYRVRRVWKSQEKFVILSILVSGLKIVVNFDLKYEKVWKIPKCCTVLVHAGLLAAVFTHLLLHVHLPDHVLVYRCVLFRLSVCFPYAVSLFWSSIHSKFW